MDAMTATPEPDPYLVHLAALAEEVEPLVLNLLDSAPKRLSKEDLEDHPWIIDAVQYLNAIDLAVDGLKKLREVLAVAFCKALPFQTSHVSIPGLPPVEPKWSKARTAWRNDDLARDVKPLLVVDENGEKLDPEAAVAKAFSVVSLNGSNVKTTGLRALGLEPGDYCQEETKDPTVVIVR